MYSKSSISDFFAEPLSGANLINILAAFLHLPKS